MSVFKNRKTKVMIIEDEEDILVLFRDYLSSRDIMSFVVAKMRIIL